MCGISGIISKNTQSELPEINIMTQCLSHRGPDKQSTITWPGVSFGHTRLTIIDPYSGDQPMSDDSNKYSIIYNGELYNFIELRKLLITDGYVFHSNSDTEVVLYSYIKWGKECVKKFRGMFAFAIYDRELKQIFLARDHIGIKPLYYFQDNKFFAFASELQSLKALTFFPHEINLSALDQFLCFQYIPAPDTIYKNVKKLKPGTILTFDVTSFNYEIEDYWEISFSENRSISETDLLNELDQCLEESVRSHLISDVPFGAFLSGGIDSTLVVDYMSSILKEPVQTFTIGFSDAAYDESQFAKYVSKKLGTNHKHKNIEADALSILPGLVKSYGEPFGDSSAVPTYYVCKMASEQVKMVLSGDGGDELFAGYNSYGRWMQKLTKHGMSNWKKLLYPMAQKVLPAKYPEQLTGKNWISVINYFTYEERKFLWKEEYSEFVSNHGSLFNFCIEQNSNLHPIKRVQVCDLYTYLPNDILNKVDIASMMHSLEVRTPLVDHVLWEFMSNIPTEFNFTFERGNFSGKQLLKKLLLKKYPKEFVNRKKTGFAVPLQNWFSSKDQADYVNQHLLGAESTLGKYFNYHQIEQIINNKNTGKIWLLLFLEEWLKQNKM